MTNSYTPGSSTGQDATGKVIAMQPNHSFPGCRDLEAYWDGLRAGRIVPSRSDFDPRGVESTLSYTFVAEKVAPRVARIRVAGSHLGDLLGMDVRGMPLTAFLDPESRDQLGAALEKAFETPERVTIDLVSHRSFARREMIARMVLLPMSDASGKVTRLVGCFETANAASRAPRRFSISSLQSFPLVGVRPKPESFDLGEPERPPVQRVVRTPVQPDKAPRPQAFAEAPTPFTPAIASRTDSTAHGDRVTSSTGNRPDKAARSHLRLVVSND